MAERNPFRGMNSRQLDREARLAMGRMKAKKVLRNKLHFRAIQGADDIEHWEDKAFGRKRIRLHNA